MLNSIFTFTLCHRTMDITYGVLQGRKKWLMYCGLQAVVLEGCFFKLCGRSLCMWCLLPHESGIGVATLLSSTKHKIDYIHWYKGLGLCVHQHKSLQSKQNIHR